MAGTNLNKYLLFTYLNPTSFKWECVQGKPSTGVSIPTCDDCIDFLGYGVNATQFSVKGIGIPMIGSTGIIYHQFSGNLRIDLCECYNAETEINRWASIWQTAQIIAPPPNNEAVVLAVIAVIIAWSFLR